MLGHHVHDQTGGLLAVIEPFELHMHPSDAGCNGFDDSARRQCTVLVSAATLGQMIAKPSRTATSIPSKTQGKLVKRQRPYVPSAQQTDASNGMRAGTGRLSLTMGKSDTTGDQKADD